MNDITTVLGRKKVFPMSVEEICHIIKQPYQLCGVDGRQKISRIVASDNALILPNCLFIPYEETEEFFVSAVKKGAAAIMTDRVLSSVPCIVVEDLEKALFAIDEYLFGFINLPSIVVSGSTGKTTTKRMVREVLLTEKRVFSETGNYNTLHALCCTMQRVTAGSELIVQEVDESRRNCTVNCSSIIRPHIALVTNIAESHIGLYGGKEGLRASICGITAGMDENGIVIINGDDADSVKAAWGKRIIRVGIHDETAHCRALHIKETEKGLVFDLVYQNETVPVKLSIFGEHNVYNAMMAFVTGKLEGLSTANILKGLERCRNFGIRQNVVKTGEFIVYADCYNASAPSIRNALRCLDTIGRGRGKKVAVLGDISEIDGFEEDVYRKIAGAVDESAADILVTYGKESCRINDYLTRKMEAFHTEDRKELIWLLIRLKMSGCRAFLFKASRTMQLEKAIAGAFPIAFLTILSSNCKGINFNVKALLHQNLLQKGG